MFQAFELLHFFSFYCYLEIFTKTNTNTRFKMNQSLDEFIFGLIIKRQPKWRARSQNPLIHSTPVCICPQSTCLV